MAVLRFAELIDAPVDAVLATLWDPDTWRRVATAGGVELAVAGRGCTIAGAKLRWPGHQLAVDPRPAVGGGPVLRSGAGPRDVVLRLLLAATGAGVLVTGDVCGPRSTLVRLRGRILRAATIGLGILTLAAQEVGPVRAGESVPDRGCGAAG